MDLTKFNSDGSGKRKQPQDHGKIFFRIDHREVHSGISHFLNQNEVHIDFVTLKVGDYIVNNKVIIERKSGTDFVQSLISNRLFNQIARLAKSPFQHFLLLEGNPFKTDHRIEANAIKGAFLSIMAAWQTPIIYSKNIQDSALLMMMLGRQIEDEMNLVRQNPSKPKRLKSHQLRFIQGLPKVGPLLAKRLFDYFGSIEAIVNANEKELRRVEGIGSKSAGRIRRFVSLNND